MLVFITKVMNPLLNAVDSFSDWEPIELSPDMEWNSEDGGHKYEDLN